jgi:hypothetical protein
MPPGAEMGIVSCDAPAWREVRDPSAVAALLATSGSLPWAEHTFGAPMARDLRASLRCAPDLDGDGAAEQLVRLQWSIPTGDGDWPAEAIVAVSPVDSDWRARAVVVYNIDSGQTAVERDVTDFVRLSSGRIAIRGVWSTFDSADGHEASGTWLGVLEGDRLRPDAECRAGDDRDRASRTPTTPARSEPAVAASN